jgi:hypothetical protein
VTLASPTSTTLQRLRQYGYACDVAERFIAAVQRKKDLLGFADVVAVKAGEPILAVQATSLAHVGDRLKRCTARPELHAWLKAGGRFLVMGWYLRNGLWDVKEVEVRGDQLEPFTLRAPKRRRREKAQRLLFAE